MYGFGCLAGWKNARPGSGLYFCRMPKFNQNINPVFFVVLATILEVCGDAIVRISIYKQTGLPRYAFVFLGALLLLGYGTSINLAPVEFGKVVGLYIACLFLVWQVVNFVAFQTAPPLPVLVGGALIVSGGLVIHFWKAN